MGTHKKKPYSGPLFDGYSQPYKKRQKQLAAEAARGCSRLLCRLCHKLRHAPILPSSPVSQRGTAGLSKVMGAKQSSIHPFARSFD
jgi:hypothetical protein